MLKLLLALAQLTIIFGRGRYLDQSESGGSRITADRATARFRWHSPLWEFVGVPPPPIVARVWHEGCVWFKGCIFPAFKGQNARVSEGILHTTHDKGINTDY